jgi:hypothetical protein
MVSVPHGRGIGRIEQYPGIHPGHMTITEKLVVNLPVSQREWRIAVVVL